ncbi:MAG: hypothetical protein LBV12_03680 [Puniceicoccales bacterium]|nr:hypothetical protein [Puniceicoccales bacterium]
MNVTNKHRGEFSLLLRGASWMVGALCLMLIPSGCTTSSHVQCSDYDEFYDFYNLTTLNSGLSSIQVKRISGGISVKLVEKFGVFYTKEQLATLDAKYVRNIDEIGSEYSAGCVIFSDKNDVHPKNTTGLKVVLVSKYAGNVYTLSRDGDLVPLQMQPVSQ